MRNLLSDERTVSAVTGLDRKLLKDKDKKRPGNLSQREAGS